VAGVALGPTGYGNSPYQSLSSFAGNGLLISPDWLIEDGLLRPVIACTIILSIGRRLQHSYPVQTPLLEKAWTNFVKSGIAELRFAFEQFCHEQAHWLEDYALFRRSKSGTMALTISSGRRSWSSEYRKLWPGRRDLANQVDQVCFAQFLLFRQGERLEKHARAKGMRLIGDLTLFCFS
jgi:4-alpha-glucanotransferase